MSERDRQRGIETEREVDEREEGREREREGERISKLFNATTNEL